jgi:hypothetical protein
MNSRDLNHEIDILSERGQFWLAGDIEQMTAETATRATLTIGARGAIDLKLDKDEWKWADPTDALANILSKKFAIVGLLAESGRYVRLERAFAQSAHPFGPRGPVVTVIGAFVCMVSDRTSVDLRAQSLVGSIRLPLGPLRAWLNLPMPKLVTGEGSCDVHYAEEPTFEFPTALGQLVITSASTADSDFTERTLTIKQQAWMEFSLNAEISLEKAAELFSDIEDLLLLLTDHEVSLDWPSIGFSGLEATGTLYCTRVPRAAAKFSAIECWLLFPHISEKFGAIIDRWIELRDEFSPAFHLYLGTRRGVDLYVEHRFVNLIWGLEALHRQSSGEGISRQASEKINRILASVNESLSARDRNWLTNRLNQAVEPNLAERLSSVFSEVPLRISPKAAGEFAKRCADRRNDISHRGGPSQRGGYNPFILELHKLSGALSHIYHAAILLRLGIAKEQIEHIFFDAFCGGIIRSRLQDAGLRPLNPSAAAAGIETNLKCDAGLVRGLCS